MVALSPELPPCSLGWFDEPESAVKKQVWAMYGVLLSVALGQCSVEGGGAGGGGFQVY